MKKESLLIYFISFIYLLNCYPSDEIWNNVIEYINLNKMVLNNHNYFIFQENNYCNKSLDSDEMKYLYEKQKSFFTEYETPNYIFVVNNFNENQESIEDGTLSLSQYISTTFEVNLQKSVIALFSIETRRIRVQTGENTKKILTDDEIKDTISSLKELLGKNNYYSAFLKYYEKIDYHMKNEYLGIGAIIYLSILFSLLGMSFLIAIVMGIYECITGKGTSSNYSSTNYSSYGGGCGGGGGGGVGGATGGW